VKLWVVEMLRYGDRESHSYVEGVYDSEEKAQAAAKQHCEWRGGKYESSIAPYELGQTSIERFELNRPKLKEAAKQARAALSGTAVKTGDGEMNTIQGWQCPACGTVYSPFVSQCSKQHYTGATKTTDNTRNTSLSTSSGSNCNCGAWLCDVPTYHSDTCPECPAERRKV
jgi:hypothetical protein